jgi:membrane protein
MANPRGDQGVRDSELELKASGAVPDPPVQATGIAGLIQKVLALKPVRVFLHYNSDNGPLIASGMTYQAFFSLAAALWFTFSVFGFVLSGNAVLQNAVFHAIDGFAPGLISYNPLGGDPVTGAIEGSALLNSTAFTWSSAISLLGVLFTAVGFLATLRTAIRIMFDLPGPTENFAIQKAKDLGLAIAFGAVVLLTALVSLASNTALDFVGGLLGLGKASPVQQVLTSVVATALLIVIETLLLAAAFRILSGIPVPRRRLWAGALIGGVGLALLQTLGTSLLHGTKNPLIAGFAVLIGVLIFFSFVCQIILLSAAWIAVGMLDAGIDAKSLSPEQHEEQRAERIEEARRLVARANQEALEQRVRESRGLRRWRLARDLQREVRAEAQRRKRVPTASELSAARNADEDPSPQAVEIEQAGSEPETAKR